MKQIIFTLLIFLSITSFSQIYAPESINMPGSWDSWDNPPTNTVFANDSQSIGGQIHLISDLLTSHYQTIFSTPTDVSSGTYNFLFTSGSSSNYFQNKWANVTVTFNSIQTYIKEGSTNNSITLNDNKFYVMNFENTGYSNSRAIFMELSSTPVYITSIKRTIDIPDSSQNDTLIIITNDNPSSEQIFYVRYTNDNWSTSNISEFTFINDSAFAIIPKQASNTEVEYYIFSTTIQDPTTDFDLISINFDNNSGKNYKYSIYGELCCNGETSVLTTNPIFPLQTGNVIISFDATLGNGALAGDTNNIYAHIGVITSESSNKTDWLYVKTEWGENTSDTKFTKIGADFYELSIPNIRNYFGVPEEEEILQIALVIRSEKPIAPENPDDFIVARAADGSDLYIDVYDDELAVKITNPPKKNPLVELNSIIPICSYAMGHTNFSIFIDGNLIQSSSSDTIIYGLNTNDYLPGMHSIVVDATDGTIHKKDSTHFFIREDVTTENLPIGMKNGINYIDENTVTLVLEDPICTKEYAFVIGEFNNWQIADSLYMKKTPDGKYFWLTISGLNSGKEYAYQYYIDGEIKIADAYCDKILDPWNDKYIPNYNYSSLKQYPFDLTKGIVSVLQTGQTDYLWTINDFEPVANADSLANLIIYELLIRDFVSTSAIKDVEKRLDYLQSLGINAIELMPFNEFEGNSSWGYNPSFYFATDKYYGKKNDYKHFIDECHKRGIAVIMDMVLNHSFGQSPLVQMYWNDVEKKPTANNPWYNQEATHPLSPGYDFNHESTHTKNFVKDVLEYWLTEYKIDGFRFDLSKGFTQTYSGSDINLWSAYDQSRINIWNEYYSFIKSINDKAYVILEHLGHNDEEIVLANTGMLLWANMNEQYTQTSMGFNTNSDFSNSLYSNRGFTYPNLIAYMESHDEERIMYKNLNYGNANGSYNIKDEGNAINTAAGVAAFYLLFPGPKMIWQFGEFGYDYSINYCQDGTINEDCRTSEKPIHWQYLNDEDRQQIFAVYQNLLKLKTTEEAFRTGTFTYDISGTGKREWISSAGFNLLAIGNFDVTSFSMTYNFQHTGTWYNLFNQTTLNVTDINMTENFEPGEFHIYTDNYYPLEEIPVKNNKITENKINIFPNPANNFITIQSSDNFNIDVYDLTGKKVSNFTKTTNTQTLDISKLNTGIYSFVFKNDKKVVIKKVVIN